MQCFAAATIAEAADADRETAAQEAGDSSAHNMTSTNSARKASLLTSRDVQKATRPSLHFSIAY